MFGIFVQVDDVSGLVDDDKSLVMPWINCHLAQVLLLGSPSLAKGHLVQVYNSAHGDSQWHRARVLCADDQTKVWILIVIVMSQFLECCL